MPKLCVPYCDNQQTYVHLFVFPHFHFDLNLLKINTDTVNLFDVLMASLMWDKPQENSEQISVPQAAHEPVII